MDGSPIDLAEARRARSTRAERRGLPLVIQAEPGAVRVLLGTREDGFELGLSPELAEELAAELARASADARKESGS